MSDAPNEVSRRQVLHSAAALALASTLPNCGDSGSGRRPNVLFVFSDAHRACSTGCYGNADVRTPHFDALASQGLRLTNAVSSTPQCRPYRSALMSGRFGHHNGLLGNSSPHNFHTDPDGRWNPGDAPTLGRVFTAAGYRCGYVGKWHLGDTNIGRGSQRLGFDDSWAAIAGQAHDYYDWSYFTDAGHAVSVQGRFQPTVATDLALEFIDGADERPWLLALSWGPPHEPFEPPGEFRRAGPIPARPNVPERKARRTGREDLPGYYGLIEAIDDEFGRLVQHLGAQGLADDTIVVYTSDHGVMLLSHGYAGKELPYSESTVVPFVIRWPGRIPAGDTLAMPFGTPDILPTLAGLAGMPVPAGLDGGDFSERLRGGLFAAEQEAAYLAGYDDKIIGWPGWRGVRTADHLYACTEEGPWILHDLRSDPYEMENLVDEDPATLAVMQELIADLMRRTGDAWRPG